MILSPTAQAMPLFLPLLRGMAEHLAKHGVKVDPQEYLVELMAGTFKLVAAYDSEQDILPAWFFTYREALNRGQKVVVIYHFFAPKLEEAFQRDNQGDAKLLEEFFQSQGFQRVLLTFNDPTVPRLVEKLGGRFSLYSTTYELHFGKEN